jgi:hypothetical protein
MTDNVFRPPLGSKVARIWEPDRPRDLVGAVGVTPSGNTTIRVGRETEQRDGWTALAHVVLTYEERRRLIDALNDLPEPQEISDPQTHSMPGDQPQWELRHRKTGRRVYVGDTLRGRGGLPAVVEGFDPPHKPDASGRVLFEGGDRLYAHSVGCEYVRVGLHGEPLEDEQELPDECGAVYTTGGNDPYSTSCTLPPRHDDLHRGPDPFGGDGTIGWRGGQMAGGDRTPYRDVAKFEVVAAGTASVDNDGTVRLDIHPSDEAGA